MARNSMKSRRYLLRQCHQFGLEYRYKISWVEVFYIALFVTGIACRLEVIGRAGIDDDNKKTIKGIARD